MKRFAVLLLLVFVAGVAVRGEGPQRKVRYKGGKSYMYRLTLIDKQGTPFSLSRPEDYLSPRAIERRRRQGIDVDSTDLPLSPLYLEEITAQGVTIVSRSKWNNTVLVSGSDEQRLEDLQQLSCVVVARKVWTSPDSVLPPPRRERMAPLMHKWDTIAACRHGQARRQIDMVGGAALHEAGYTGQGVMIAVMDGGFMNADQIRAFMSMNRVGVKDFVVPVSPDIFAEMKHGTEVLSVMAANLPGVYVGTAPDAGYLLLRCEDNSGESLAEEDFWAAAAEYADSMGTDIINCSVGFHDFDCHTDDFDYAALDGRTAMISRTASMLADKGIVMVCSAGNDGMETWKKINFPADARDVLTVGAVADNGVNAAFSSIGPTADGRVKPDLMATGSPTTVITGRGTVGKDVGTSFAAPIISGLTACLWQALPSLTAHELIDLVRSSADRYAAPDNIFGYGIPRFDVALEKLRTKN